MSTLHPALRPWEPHLLGLAPAAETTLSAWLPRLAALLGTARRRSGPEHGDPDGYDGFVNRGPLDRLSIEDHAQRELEELEFLRRYASGELRYHRLARRVPAAARRSLVLFDTGPEQLGAARLVHLALLVALARRAQQEGGVLSWSALPTGGQVNTVSLPDDLVKLAGARSWTTGPWSVEGWQARIAAIDDLFVVGGDAAAALATGLRGELLRVTEVGEELIVQRGARRVALPLPDRGLAASALNAPLGGRAPSDKSRKIARFQTVPRTLLFSPSGGHLFVELVSGAVAAVRCGAKRSRKGFRPAQCGLDEGERAIAATIYKRHLFVVTRTETELRLHGSGRPGRVVRTGPWPEPPTDGLRPALVEGSKSGPMVYFLDGSDRLHRLDASGYRPFEGPVLAFARGPAGHRMLMARGGERLVDFQREGPPPQTTGVALPEASDGYLGPLVDSVNGQVSPASTLAFRIDEVWWVQRAGSWQQDRQPAVRVGQVAADDRVIGAICAPTLGVHEALVVLVDGRRVVARTPTSQVTLLTLPVPAINAAVSPATLHLAVARADGVIAVIDLKGGTSVIELSPGTT